MITFNRFGLRGFCGTLATILALGAADPVAAWNQPQWVRQLGTPEREDAVAVATDRDGNVYISGTTDGLIGGQQAGFNDAWVAKYDPAGALLWIRQLGTPTYDFSYDVATDRNGNVYITGVTNGTFGGTQETNGQAWIAKYFADGDLRWTRQLGTAESGETTRASGVATDGAGNVYISGQTVGSLGGPLAGCTDAWVAKYSDNGKLLWTRQLGTAECEDGWRVATDLDGNVYISGTTDGSLAGPINGATDAWVAKYTTAGRLLWKRQLGSSGSEGGSGVAADPDGNVYISGGTDGSLAGPNNGAADAWVAKYTTAGRLLWKRQLGSSGSEGGSGVATDPDGNVYISGVTYGSLAGRQRGNGDAWLAKYSAAGELLWKRQLGTPQGDVSTGVAIGSDGDLYISGWTNGSLGGPNSGNTDAWVAKYFTRR